MGKADKARTMVQANNNIETKPQILAAGSAAMKSFSQKAIVNKADPEPRVVKCLK